GAVGSVSGFRQRRAIAVGGAADSVRGLCCLATGMVRRRGLSVSACLLAETICHFAAGAGAAFGSSAPECSGLPVISRGVPLALSTQAAHPRPQAHLSKRKRHALYGAAGCLP